MAKFNVGDKVKVKGEVLEVRIGKNDTTYYIEVEGEICYRHVLINEKGVESGE